MEEVTRCHDQIRRTRALRRIGDEQLATARVADGKVHAVSLDPPPNPRKYLPAGAPVILDPLRVAPATLGSPDLSGCGAEGGGASASGDAVYEPSGGEEVSSRTSPLGPGTRIRSVCAKVRGETGRA